MKNLRQNSEPVFLLALYCFIVVAGSLLSVSTFLYFHSYKVTIEPSQGNAPGSGQPSWVQNRHIPAFPKLETNPSALALQVPFPQTARCEYLHYVQPFLLSCTFKFFRFLPRDPPSA